MRPEASSSRGILSADTSLDAERRQIEIWRSLSSVQIAQLIADASHAARELAAAGVRTRYPNASHEEVTARLGVITLGPELARSVYPELQRLGL